MTIIYGAATFIGTSELIVRPWEHRGLEKPDPIEVVVLPMVAIRNVILDAAELLDAPRPAARQGFVIWGDEVTVRGTPRVQTSLSRYMGKDFARYYCGIDPWSLSFECAINDEYVNRVTFEQWCRTAGLKIGLGEWRPKHANFYGMFCVDGFDWRVKRTQ